MSGMVGVRRRAGSGGDKEGCLVSFHGAGTRGAKLWENRDRKGQQRCMLGVCFLKIGVVTVNGSELKPKGVV